MPSSTPGHLALPELAENVQLVAPSSLAVLPPGFSRRPEASLFDLEQPQVSPNSSTPSTSDAPSTSSSSPFVTHHAAFLPLLGPSPTLTVLAEDPDGISFAHEAPVWWKETAEVSFSANVLGKGGEDPFDVRSPIYKVNLEGRLSEEVRMRPSIPMPNGAIRFGDRILWCAQGRNKDEPSALVLSNPSTDETEVLLNNFLGRAFNSLNDIAILPPPSWSISEQKRAELSKDAFTTAGVELHKDPGTSIWFTDPTYGNDQLFRPEPELPTQVYCLNPSTGSVRVVADSFDHCNGICFNLEGTICYITDTGFISGKHGIRPTRPNTIYAFDVVQPPTGSDLSLAGPTLTNRRVFAYTDSGAPDGIKCDRDGNVYTGCFDGLHVFHPSGTLLGRIVFFPDPTSASPTKARGCANFCFVPGGIVMLAEDRIYLAKISEKVVGALLPTG